MSNRNDFIIYLLLFTIASFSACKKQQPQQSQAIFTQADSLTEVFLNYQDSILLNWNLMRNDDNKKIKAMLGLLHELEIGGNLDPKNIHALEERIRNLKDTRYTNESISNIELVEEYDFVSNSLISELISLAESHTSYTSNTAMKSLVEQIRMADQRVENYRASYDKLITAYNKYLDQNRAQLENIDVAGNLDKMPMFQTSSE